MKTLVNIKFRYFAEIKQALTLVIFFYVVSF